MNAYLTSLQHSAFYQTCKILYVEVTDPNSGMIARSYCDGQALHYLLMHEAGWAQVLRRIPKEIHHIKFSSTCIWNWLHQVYHFLLNRNLVWVELPSTVGWFTSQPAAGYLFAPPGLDSWQPKKASRHGFVKARIFPSGGGCSGFGVVHGGKRHVFFFVGWKKKQFPIAAFQQIWNRIADITDIWFAFDKIVRIPEYSWGACGHQELGHVQEYQDLGQRVTNFGASLATQLIVNPFAWLKQRVDLVSPTHFTVPRRICTHYHVFAVKGLDFTRGSRTSKQTKTTTRLQKIHTLANLNQSQNRQQ